MLNEFRKFNLILQKGITVNYLKIQEVNPNVCKPYEFMQKMFLPNHNEIKETQLATI